MKDYKRKTLVVVRDKTDALFGARALEGADAVAHQYYFEGPRYVWYWIEGIRPLLCGPEHMPANTKNGTRGICPLSRKGFGIANRSQGASRS